MEHRLPGNLNISFAYVEGEALLMGIKDVAVSSGSACTSASLEPSYVLRALGVGDELAHTSIRFGLGRFNTEEEVDYVAELVVDEGRRGCARCRRSTRWRKEGIDLEDHRVGGALSDSRRREEQPWRTAKRSSTTTRTRATSARFDKDDPNVGTGLVGAPACGDVMKLQIKVARRRRHRGRQVQDLRLRLGDRLVVARRPSGSRARRVDEAMAIKNTQIVEELNLPPVKIHCSVLAEDAIKAAIADYKEKRAKTDGSGLTSRKRTRSKRLSDGGADRPWPIAVTDTAVAEIEKAARRSARTTPEGAARRHPRRRLHGLLLPVRVVGQEPRAEDKVLAFEDGARARVRRSEELHLPRRARRSTTRPR